MRILIVCLFLFLGSYAFGQKALPANVDSSNYYNYYIDPSGLGVSDLVTDWLEADEAIPIITEELRKAGFEWLSENSMFKLKSGQIILLSAYSRKSNFGFLYFRIVN